MFKLPPQILNTTEIQHSIDSKRATNTAITIAQAFYGDFINQQGSSQPVTPAILPLQPLPPIQRPDWAGKVIAQPKTNPTQPFIPTSLSNMVTTQNGLRLNIGQNVEVGQRTAPLQGATSITGLWVKF